MAKNYITAGFSKIITIIYGLLLLKILSTHLSSTEFSNYFLLYNASMYISSIFFGLQGAIILRYWNILGKEKIISLIKTLNTIAFFLMSALIIIIYLFSSLERESLISIALLIISTGLFANLISTYRINTKFTSILKATILQASTAILLLFIFHHELNAVYSLSLVAISFITPFFLLKTVDIKAYYPRINMKLIDEHRDSLHYAYPIVFIGSLNFMMSSLDQYFLKYFKYDNELPAYIANYNIAEKSVFVILSIITLVFVPSIFNKYKVLTKKTFKDILIVEAYFITISIVVLALIAYFSGSLTAILTDAKYNTHSWIIPYIAFGALILGINSILSEVLTVQYKTKIVLFCYIIGFISNFTLNYLLIEKHGVSGAIATTIFSYLLTLITTLFFVIKEYNNLRLSNRNIINE